MVGIEHILEKGSGRVNEDCLVMEKDLFGVFDGATSLETPQGIAMGTSLRTGGALASAIARDTFAKNHYPLTRLGATANRAISRQMTEAGMDPDRPELAWSTSAAVVRLKQDATLEWFCTGDAQIMLIFEDNGFSVLADQPDHDYETLVMLKAQKDKTLSNPRLKRQLLKVRGGMNKTYGVLNGAPNAMDLALSGQTGLDRVKTVLLFTDGLSLPSAAPAPKKDFTPLARNFQNLGLRGLHKKIRDMEKSDPDRRRFPRFKCHDDIAAIALHLN